jgi:hypothetical protein
MIYFSSRSIINLTTQFFPIAMLSYQDGGAFYRGDMGRR